MKKILITGCAGLFGVNFSEYLLSKNYYVIGVDNFFGGYDDFLPNHTNFQFFKIDLENTNEVRELFSKNDIDIVFHFAAYAAEGLSPFIRKFNYMNNVISSINLINECIERDIKIVFTSSMAVYGEQQTPFHENQTPNPIDPYGIAKFTVEQDLISASDQFGLKFNIVRPHNVVGIYQNIWDRYRNVIGIFIRRTINGENILVYGDGTQKRAFSDIQFYMQPLEKLIYNHDNKIYNIGADKYFTIHEIAQLVQKISGKFGFNPQIEFVEARHEVQDAYCNHDKSKIELSFNDDTDIENLIEKMFVWAISQPNRDVKKMNYEITKNIYNFWK
jgi:UDP-glucose 4-epimerase